MLTLDSLKNFGADVETGVARCAGKEDLYLKLVQTIPADEKFDSLKDALESKDFDRAFDIVHALKGVVTNLSITPLYDKISELTEYLRNKEDRDYTAILDEILNLKNRLSDLCK